MTLCLYFISNQIRSQNGQIEYQKIDITYGLAQNTVDCIYQDKVGFLWFGTRYGLSRFDGINFVNYQNDPKNNETLSNKSINDICEDLNENIYIATDNGLSIYIRLNQKFKQIYRDTLNKVTLPSNSVYALKIDEKNRLWIGTRKGLVLYDLTNNKFTSPHTLFKNAATIEKEHIMTIHIDKNNVYVGTAYSGLYILDKKEKSFNSYLVSKRNQYSYLNNTIFSILSDTLKNVWLATGNGIAKFDLDTKKIKRYLASDDLSKIESYIVFNDLLKTKNGELLCGSSDFGMYKYNTSSDEFLPYNIRHNESGKLSGKSYLSMIEDRTGVLWLGTRNEGLVKVNLRKKPFKWIGHDIENKSSIVDNNIFALLEDSKKNIWIGTLQGISIIDIQNNLIKNLQPDSSASNTIRSNRIWALFEDSKKNVWIGTADGLNIFHPHTNKFDFISTDYSSQNQLADNEVFALNEDKKGNIWIGTAYGLSKYSADQNKFTNYYYSEKDTATIPSNNIWAVYVDSKERIWIATDKGIAIYMPEKNSFKRIKITSKRETEWTGVNTISEDSAGILWLGTDIGLVKLNPDNYKAKNYSIFDKTGNLVVFSVQAFRNFVWFSVINGIARLNIKTDELVLFTDKDGIKSSEFNFPSAIVEDSLLYFGGTNGITYFDPTLIEIDTFAPSVVLTGLKINFEEIFPGDIYRDDIPLETNINSTNTINLHYDDNIFSISFASLDFKNKEKIEYAYIMEGINNDWIKLGSQNFVNFTGLKPGNYQLKVKATNSDGIWNSEIKYINIVISPPWWQTKTFIALLAISLFIAILLIIKRREQSLKRAKDILEEKVHDRTREISMQKEEIKSQNDLIEKQYNELVEKSELIEKQNLKLKNKAIHLEEEIQQRHADLILAKDRAEESDRLKSAFISNISHEIRTPLNAVIGFTELLSYQDVNNEDRTKFMDVIKKSSNDLLLLLNKLIDIAVIESKKITISNSFFKLNIFLNDLKKFHKKNTLVKSKQLKILSQFDIEDDKFLIYCDKERLKQILNSLISNAIKYTENGSVSFGYSKKENYLEFFVSDTGIGIPKNKLSQLFSRFSKFEQSKDKLYRGAGLSLSISKDLIELMGGKIWAESEVNKGTTFYFNLPINLPKINRSPK